MASVTFKRGTRAEIEATAKQDGQILMETDQTNNKMYVDLQNNNRVRIGNSNVDDISGITDSLTATSSNIALSAAGGNNLQGQIDTLNSNLISKLSYSNNDYDYVDGNFRENGTFKILGDGKTNTKIIIGQTILSIDWYADYTILKNITFGFLYCTNVSSGVSKYLNGTNNITGLSASKGQTITFFGVFTSAI